MIASLWQILNQASIFILGGFLVAGLLNASRFGERVLGALGGTRRRSVLYATLIGAPLPLCSCSVLPAAVAMRRKGAGRGATLAFLISTPETSITSILLTYALMGPLMAVVRPVAACATALIAGLVEAAFERSTDRANPDGPATVDCAAACGTDRAPAGRIATAVRYAFVDLFDDLFGWLALGILVAAAIQTWLSPEALATIARGPISAMALMTVIGVPLYVCAEASTPIAAALAEQGLHPGAALVLLLVGPATNIGALGVLRREFGMRVIVTYLLSVVLVAWAAGGLLMLLPAEAGPRAAEATPHAELLPVWLTSAAAIVFLVLGLASLARSRFARRSASWLVRRRGARSPE